MKINVLPLIAVCVLTLCCLVTAGMYRMKTAENARLQAQVNGLREHNMRLMGESSELRAQMDRGDTRRYIPAGVRLLNEIIKPSSAP